MNQQDLNTLTDAWHSDTGWLNDKIDEFFKAAQDHAYALGFARGLQEAKTQPPTSDTSLQPAHGVPDDVVRDAERYRWLRDRDYWPAPFASSQDPEPVRGIDLDAAIDAAMLASPAQKGGE